MDPGLPPRSSSFGPGSVLPREQARRSLAERGWGSPWSRSLRTPSWTCSSTGSPTYSNIQSVTGGHRGEETGGHRAPFTGHKTIQQFHREKERQRRDSSALLLNSLMKKIWQTNKQQKKKHQNGEKLEMKPCKDCTYIAVVKFFNLVKRDVDCICITAVMQIPGGSKVF